jgi:hypothetical protein
MVVNFPGRFFDEVVGMNSYALGRIVAGEVVAARFISARKSTHYGDVHCAFRRTLQSPDM